MTFVLLFREILLPAPALQDHDQMMPPAQSYGSGPAGGRADGSGADGAASYGGTYGGTGASGVDVVPSDASKVTVTVAGGGSGPNYL